MSATENQLNGGMLPDGWLVVRVSDICDLNPPKPGVNEVSPDTEVTFVPMPAVDADRGGITNPQVRRFAEVRKGFTFFRNDDVIVAKITPCFENGKAAVCRGLLNGLGFGSTEFHVFRSTGGVLPEYIFHFIRQESLRREGEANMSGSVGQKRVPADWVKSIAVPLPPLAEQKRIVAKVQEVLDRVNAARERLAKLPTILKRFRQSVLAAACSGRLTADWRDQRKMESTAADESDRVEKERFAIWCDAARAKARAEGRTIEGVDWQSRYERPQQINVVDLPELPSAWRWASFDTFAATFQYGPRFGEDEYVPTGTPTVRTSDMDFRGRITLKNPPRVKVTPELVDHYGLRQDDLVVTRTGATIGKCALYDESLGAAIASAYLIRYRMPTQTASAQYLLTMFMSPWGQQHLLGGTTAVAQPNVNTKTIAAIPIAVPPLAEQREIVRRLITMFALADKIEARLAAGLMRSEKLIQSTLAKAFRGELVPTEAELAEREGRKYETAEALLKRVQLAHVAQVDKPARGRKTKPQMR